MARPWRRIGLHVKQISADGAGMGAAAGLWNRPDSPFVASRSEEHTSELQSLMRISYAVFCLKKKTNRENNTESKRRRRQTYTLTNRVPSTYAKNMHIKDYRA